MTDTDQYGATAGTSGVRPPRRRPPRTLGGSVVLTLVALAGLFAATAAPVLLAGVLLGSIGGVVVAVLSGRRRRAETVDFCLPRVGLCLSV